MNRAQIKRLARLSEETVPLIELYREDGDQDDTVDIDVRPDGNDFRVRLSCYTTSLVVFRPKELYITDEGVLCTYDEDQDKLVPVKLTWRYGDPGVDSERYKRICYATPVEAEVAA